jgi:hypothetical protein
MSAEFSFEYGPEWFLDICDIPRPATCWHSRTNSHWPLHNSQHDADGFGRCRRADCCSAHSVRQCKRSADCPNSIHFD